MGRLIDVDALRADYGMADDCKDCKTGYRSCEYDRIYSKMDFCGWLDDAPTVDAVPVRHGRWIQVSQDRANCNRCNCESGKMIKQGERYFPKFCPECGADMRQDGDGNA